MDGLVLCGGSSLEYKRGLSKWEVAGDLTKAGAQLAGLSRLVRKGTNPKLNAGKERDPAVEFYTLA